MILRAFFLALGLVVLNGCGGGGGGGSPGPGDTSPPSQGDFTISTDTVNIEATVGDNPAYVQITGNLANAKSDVFLIVDASGTPLVNNAGVQVEGTGGVLTIFPSNPADLPLGNNTGSILLKACKNASCSSQYSGSPKKININYKVNGISYEVSPSAVSFKMTAGHALPDAATVGMTIEKNVGYYGSTWLNTGTEQWLQVSSNWTGLNGTATFSIKKEMPVGVYTTTVDLFAFGKAFTRSVAVTFTVEAEPYQVSQRNVSFKIGDPSELANLKVNEVISTASSTDLDWVMSTDAKWLDLSASSGNTTNKTPVQISVNNDYQDLPKGLNKAIVSIQDKDKKLPAAFINVEIHVVDKGTPVTDAVANSFDIAITDTAIDNLHGKIYLTEKSTQKLYKVDVGTGLVEKYYTFAKNPEKLALSKDNKKLYVSLLEHDHDSYWFDNQVGHVAVLDLETDGVEKTMDISIDPYGIAVTSTGKLIVSGGSGQWTKLQAFDAETGASLGAMDSQIYQQQALSLDTAEHYAYTMDYNWITKADVTKSPLAFVTQATVNIYNMVGPIVAAPDGKHLITRSGELISTTDLSVEKNIFSDSAMRAMSFWFDTVNNSVIIFALNAYTPSVDIESFSLEDFQKTTLQPTGFVPAGIYDASKPHAVWLYGGKMYYLYPEGGKYKLGSVAQ